MPRTLNDGWTVTGHGFCKAVKDEMTGKEIFLQVRGPIMGAKMFWLYVDSTRIMQGTDQMPTPFTSGSKGRAWLDQFAAIYRTLSIDGKRNLINNNRTATQMEILR